ncbi:MAG TPA: hypothetical protein VLZ75_08535 [Chitinophagales bacterium]|nr:hypothetical protein [Chitinophagales bacterium]
MSKQAIIERTLKAINQLPEDKAEEISNFADFIFKKFEENQITESIQRLASQGKVFNFLNEEEDLYSTKDLKEKYNG